MQQSRKNVTSGRRALLRGAAAITTARFGRARAAADRIGVGVLTDLSGPYADSGGAGSVFAARYAAREAGPTVLGLPVDIIAADTQNKPDIASSIARDWFDAQHLDAITDLPVTPVAAAVQQVARERQRSVMITAAAVADFTTRFCSPTSTHWADDTHALSTATAQLLVAHGGRKWFFITVDFTFGKALEAAAREVILAHGGTVLGGTSFPIGNTDFASQLLQAQSSGADVFGCASVGNDQVNLFKQAAEFGLTKPGRQSMAAFLVYITDIHALGLEHCQGLKFSSGFYWNESEPARRFATAFFAERKAMPTRNQASVYLATRHYLQSMAAAGTRDPVAVNKAMRARPVDYFGRPAAVRGDGRVLYDVTLYRVRAPAEVTTPWDYYAALGSIPASEAFLPPVAACMT